MSLSTIALEISLADLYDKAELDQAKFDQAKFEPVEPIEKTIEN